MAQLSQTDLIDRVAFLDPASGRAARLKRVASRSAIVVIGADALGRVFVLHQWAARVSTQRLVDTLFLLNEQYHPRAFGCESNALQCLFTDCLELISRTKQTRLPLVPVQQPTKIDKDYRIRTSLQPVIGYGRLFLQPQHHELRSELEAFPQGQTKDLVDALASAVRLLKPISLRHERDSKRDALATYLRKTGAPSWYIERRCGTAL